MLNLLALPLVLCLNADPATAEAPHVTVNYTGISEAQASALAETCSAAWTVYTDEFAVKMPERVVFQVTCGPDEQTRLYTDGQDRMFLYLKSPKQLNKPAESGVFNLYGVCHELGHIAMYRTVKDRDWMTTAAAEGWAHYAGSVVVDRVFKAKGQRLWSDPYDYSADGSPRLDKALAGNSPSNVDRGAGQWRKLEALIGRKGFVKLFQAWEEAKIDATNPSDPLLETLTRQKADKRSALEEWWKTTGPLFIEKREVSSFKAVVIPATKLTGKPVRLFGDDDQPDGATSIAGSGHARRFETPSPGEWYIRSVWIYGGRYGLPRTNTTFDVALCDTDLKPMATWKRPMSLFERGDGQWVKIDVPPTRVPKTFMLALNFRPTATNGVRVAYDSSTQGHSVTGTPGATGHPFNKGDWMIRVELDQPKEADALGAAPPTSAPKPGVAPKPVAPSK